MTELTDITIREQIKKTLDAGKHTLRITGDYVIHDTVFLPSDFTLILDDCRLCMADGVYAQMFRNAGAVPWTHPGKGAHDHDIRLIGVGRAILDGGNYNGLSERNSEKNGNPHISLNNLLLFCNVSGFEVRNVQIRRQRWWALNFLFCDHGVIRDVDFCADDTRILPDGSRVQGLTRSDYEGVYVKNADGIDLRAGCHDILIENITGFCEDDIVALTDLRGKLEDMYGVPDGTHDIYNVVIRNVRGCSFCSMIRLLNQSGAKMYNILIDGVFDDSADSPHMDRGVYGVRVGDAHLYGPAQPQDDDLHTVSIRNVYARAVNAVGLAGGMTDISLDNINGFDGCSSAVRDDRPAKE